MTAGDEHGGASFPRISVSSAAGAASSALVPGATAARQVPASRQSSVVTGQQSFASPFFLPFAFLLLYIAITTLYSLGEKTTKAIWSLFLDIYSLFLRASDYRYAYIVIAAFFSIVRLRCFRLTISNASFFHGGRGTSLFCSCLAMLFSCTIFGNLGYSSFLAPLGHAALVGADVVMSPTPGHRQTRQVTRP